VIRAKSRFFLGAAVVIAALVSTGVSASAATNGPYAGTGYDISYPQCNGTSLQSSLPSGSFGIVGVNHGRPFTSNPCFAAGYKYAATSGRTPSLYINTAYSGAYRRSITPYCSQQLQSVAWRIGCSEAESSWGYAGKPKSTAVFAWWLDVETANSWSSSNVSLNQETIQGAADRLLQLDPAVPVGVYSTKQSWATITGATVVYTPVNTSGEWVAGAAGLCATSNAFDGNPIWLSQFPNGGFDSDNAC